MQVAVFHTKGSNRIDVDVYTDKEVSVSLIANNTIQDQITAKSTMINNGVVHIIFNFLRYNISYYSISANDGTNTIIKLPEVIDSPVSKYETNLYEDDFTKKTNHQNESVDAEVITEEIIRGEYLKVDFSSTNLIQTGEGNLNYNGGGNRYLNDKNGLLILQASNAESINDKYSPLSLGTEFKIEHATTNLYNGFSTNSLGKEQVQAGLLADVFSSNGKDLIVDFNPIKFEPDTTYCFSSIMKVSEDANVSLEYLDENGNEQSLSEEIDGSINCDVSQNYEMCSMTFQLDGTYRLRLKTSIFNHNKNRLFLLLPQVEAGTYPTSRVLNNKSRIKDELYITPFGLSNMENGGYVFVKVTMGRKISTAKGHAIVEWINEEGNGLRIMQDSDNSIVACLNENSNVDSVTSTPLNEMSEGDEVSIKVEYSASLIKLSINDNEFSNERTMSFIPTTTCNILLGYSESNLDSFDGNISLLRLGK